MWRAWLGGWGPGAKLAGSSGTPHGVPLAALEEAIHLLASLRKAPQNAGEPVAFLSVLLRPHAS